MRVLLQRVKSASVSVDGSPIGAIRAGLVALVGIGHEDTTATVERMANKILNMRIFEDESGKMNRSLRDLNIESGNAGVLVVSQFTLYADVRKGRRPGFSAAAEPERARRLVDELAGCFRSTGLEVGTGEFGAHMVVSLDNDGPVTIWIDSADLTDA